MEETIGPFIIERVWNAADGRQVCRIVWTTEQLHRIGQAVEEGDHAFLAEVDTHGLTPVALGIKTQSPVAMCLCLLFPETPRTV
jgi:hypothetical protein